jgi:hypothetical protein
VTIVCRIQIAILVLIVLCSAAAASGQCADRDAAQKLGSWSGRNRFGDELANADRTFPKAQYPLLLSKTDRVIAMLKTLPARRGVEAQPVRSISGSPYVKDGPVPFGVDVPIFDYYCDRNTGQIQTSGETGDWIYFSFNSLGWLTSAMSMALRTTNGARIYRLPKQTEFKGYTLLLPELNVGVPDEAIILTPDGRLPFKPLSRERYLLARQKYYQSEVDRVKELTNVNPSVLAQQQKNLAAITDLLQSMPQSDREAPAIIRDASALPGGRAKVFVTQAEGGNELVTIEPDLFKPASSRTAVRIITVYWKVHGSSPAEAEAVRLFKDSFNFEALRQMLDR